MEPLTAGGWPASVFFSSSRLTSFGGDDISKAALQGCQTESRKLTEG